MQGMPSIASLRWPAVALVASGGILSSSPAEARPEGIASDCFGCHGSDVESMLSLSSDPAEITPGAEVAFTVLVSRPGAQVGGVFVADPGIGQLGTLPGEGLALRSEGLTHTSPKAAQNGTASFRFTWRAPEQPGYVRISAFGNAANGDGARGGDAPGAADFLFTFGCPPMTFYVDGDGDGHGSPDRATLVACADQPPPEGLAVSSDDCDDTRPTTHAGAIEACNERDDDCNGAIDDGAVPQELWPDDDGDGYYESQTGTAVVACLPLSGYAAVGGDCEPRDAAQHPDAEEICNLFDDDCDGRVDEGLRPECGVGFCRRQSFTCEPAECVPGEPGPETCNLLDDDCNGVVDDGDLCAAGSGCVDGQCRAGASPTTSDDASGSDPQPAPTLPGDAPAAGGGEPAASSAEAAGCSFAAGEATPRARWAALTGALGAAAACAARARRRNRGAGVHDAAS